MKNKREWSEAITAAREALYALRGEAAVEQFDTEIGELADLADEVVGDAGTSSAAIAVCKHLIDEERVLHGTAGRDSPLQSKVRAYERASVRDASAGGTSLKIVDALKPDDAES